MQDLTKITTPFGLLDEETRQALVAHGGPYEIYTTLNGWREFVQYTLNGKPNSIADWPRRSCAIRVKPQKPSIDWSHVAPEYKWLARNASGAAYLYEFGPVSGKAMWYGSEYPTSTEGFASYQPGTCDWKDSLVERPSGE